MNETAKEAFFFEDVTLNLKSLEHASQFPMSCHNGGQNREQSGKFLRIFENRECFLLHFLININWMVCQSYLSLIFSFETFLQGTTSTLIKPG